MVEVVQNPRGRRRGAGWMVALSASAVVHAALVLLLCAYGRRVWVGAARRCGGRSAPGRFWRPSSCRSRWRAPSRWPWRRWSTKRHRWPARWTPRPASATTRSPTRGRRPKGTGRTGASPAPDRGAGGGALPTHAFRLDSSVAARAPDRRCRREPALAAAGLGSPRLTAGDAARAAGRDRRFDPDGHAHARAGGCRAGGCRCARRRRRAGRRRGARGIAGGRRAAFHRAAG